MFSHIQFNRTTRRLKLAYTSPLLSDFIARWQRSPFLADPEPDPNAAAPSNPLDVEKERIATWARNSW